jgi:CRISPR-associated protein (TIGR03984 family)
MEESAMSNDRVLYSRTADDIRLSDAVTKCAKCLEPAIGLFYSPTACEFAKIQDGNITDRTGTDLDLTHVFEARIFNQEFELRWLNRDSGTGRAVLLSQNDINKYLTDDVPEIQAIDIIDSQYLLWGEGTGNKQIDPGWSLISAARIGKLAVPIAGIDRNDRVKLRFREYLGVCDEHGNVAVVEERLLGLSNWTNKSVS